MLNKFFVDKEQINENQVVIINEDVNHIRNVLRLAVNEKIIVCDKFSHDNYVCKIIDISKERVICEIEKKLEISSESNVNIDIFQGLPKSDKMELIIQKGTELRSK